MLSIKTLTTLFLLTILFSNGARAAYRVSVGGYVPFVSSMQEDKKGELNTFSFFPTLSVGASESLEGLASDFSPEFGIVFHQGRAGNDYTKTTFYILGDLEMEWGPLWSVRYGLGLFGTWIDGKEGTVWRENGEELDEFKRPERSVISYSIALDLGWSYHFYPRWFLRMETFIFSIWDSKSRDISYMLVLGYTPPW